MSCYEVSYESLTDAQEQIMSFADDLQALSDRISRMDFELQDDTLFIKQRKSVSAGVINICDDVRNTGRVLAEVIDNYKRAEKSVYNDTDMNAAAGRTPGMYTQTVSQVIFRNEYSTVMTDNLLTPQWLKAAVINYEQSHIQ